MPEIIPPGYGQVLIPLKHGAVTRAAAITFGVDLTGAGGNYAAATAKAFFAFSDNWVGVIDDAVTLGPARLAVGQDGGENLVVVGINTSVGTSPQSSLPSNCAALVKKITGRGGRRGRGRFFVPWCLSDAAADDTGIILAGTRTNLQNRANDMLTALETNGVYGFATPMVLLHSTGQSTPGSPNVVTDLLVDGLIGSQRRRLAR